MEIKDTETFGSRLPLCDKARLRDERSRYFAKRFIDGEGNRQTKARSGIPRGA
jgi:hypothetical protein